MQNFTCPKCKEKIDCVNYNRIHYTFGTFGLAEEDYLESDNSLAARDDDDKVVFYCPRCNAILDNDDMEDVLYVDEE